MQVNPGLDRHLTKQALEHKCSSVHCAKALSIDGNQKVNRKVCASRIDVVLKTDFNHTVYGCMNIPALMSKYCAMHTTTCTEKAAAAAKKEAEEAANARRVTRSMTRYNETYEVEMIMAKQSVEQVRQLRQQRCMIR